MGQAKEDTSLCPNESGTSALDGVTCTSIMSSCKDEPVDGRSVPIHRQIFPEHCPDGQEGTETQTQNGEMEIAGLPETVLCTVCYTPVCDKQAKYTTAYTKSQ